MKIFATMMVVILAGVLALGQTGGGSTGGDKNSRPKEGQKGHKNSRPKEVQKKDPGAAKTDKAKAAERKTQRK